MRDQSPPSDMPSSLRRCRLSPSKHWMRRGNGRRQRQLSAPRRSRLRSLKRKESLAVILEFVATSFVLVEAELSRSRRDTSHYCGLLGEYPRVHPALFAEDVPNWFRTLAQDLEQSGAGSKSERIDVEEAWKKCQSGMKDRFEEQQASNLKSLCDWYRVDMEERDAGWKLAKALAAQHVPAFQVKRAREMWRRGRTKKPPKLDVYGSAYMCLDKARRTRSLCRAEELFLQFWADDFRSTNLQASTMRQLKREIDNAHSAYLVGEATNFQRQFVEEVEPLLMRLQQAHVRSVYTRGGSTGRGPKQSKWADDLRLRIFSAGTTRQAQRAAENAYKAYALGCETNFQRLYVEQIEPFITHAPG
jgi:hypothetical protein